MYTNANEKQHWNRAPHFYYSSRSYGMVVSMSPSLGLRLQIGWPYGIRAHMVSHTERYRYLVSQTWHERANRIASPRPADRKCMCRKGRTIGRREPSVFSQDRPSRYQGECRCNATACQLFAEDVMRLGESSQDEVAGRTGGEASWRLGVSFDS